MSDKTDLVESLAQAAADAVRARRGAIEAGGAGKLQAINLEIEPVNRGAETKVSTYLSWRQVIQRATK